MTDRKTASTINDTELDALYDQLAALRQVARGYCHACGRGDAAPTTDDWEQQRKRAEQLAGLAREILYATHNISSQDWARWRETLDTITGQEQPGPA